MVSTVEVTCLTTTLMLATAKFWLGLQRLLKKQKTLFPSLTLSMTTPSTFAASMTKIARRRIALKASALDEAACQAQDGG